MKKSTLIGIIVCALIFGAVIWFVAQPHIEEYIKQNNFSEFQTRYETELSPILEENSLSLISIDYGELISDYDKDYWVTERINEYEIKVYVSGDIIDYEHLYDILREISYCTNDYLLSNSYEILPDYAYVDDVSKETGFHEVITVLVFEDNSSYRLRYSTTLAKNGTKVFEAEKKPVTEESMVADADARGWDCLYEDCDHKRAEGRLYCHIHKCAVIGCTHSTSPFQEYCYEHSKSNK